MLIAVDARELLGRATGVGRYLACLLDRWSPRDAIRGHQIRLYTPEALPRPLADAWLGASVTERVVPGDTGTRWEQVRLARALRRDHPDVLFAPAYTAPLWVSTPTVLTVHDVSFVAHPKWFPWREGLRRRWVTRRAAHRARLVITVSLFSADEIVRLLGVSRAKLRVVRPGVPAIGAPDGTGLGEGRAEDGPMILYVGAILNRRHVPVLLRAFARVRRFLPTARLVIVGDNRTHPRQDLISLAADPDLGGRVTLTSHVTHDTLGSLYRSAAAFAFLSEYEGFGLTPLEALAAGVPPVLADTQVAREICGDAALYVPVGDDAGTAEALLAVLTRDGVRARLLEAATGVLARYSWDRAARETMCALEEAATDGR